MITQGETRVEVPIVPGDRFEWEGVRFIREERVVEALKAIESMTHQLDQTPSSVHHRGTWELIELIAEARRKLGIEEERT